MTRINVTKPFFPPIEEYNEYLHKIWEDEQLTNQGPFVVELEAAAKKYLGISDFQFVANGTLALQLALRALDITDGEVITTPFTYVATTSAILWERCTPVYVDIEPETFCIDTDKIEAAITPLTKAIMAVHVFGFPCNIEKIQEIADRHNLKVIYDAAHAFGATHKGKSLLDFGDISICSFHATKLFHTVEGGGIIAQDPAVSNKLDIMKRFGHNGDTHLALGINAKNSELHAAMGLCNLKYIDDLIAKRKTLHEQYTKELHNKFKLPKIQDTSVYNYSYYPVTFDTGADMNKAIKALNEKDIFPRRYFYPSLNTLPYLGTTKDCPISEDIASRILCLPFYAGLEEQVVNNICEVLKK
jgi:dTDP-4-amino-4,6-dideoxygalactose transaminase